MQADPFQVATNMSFAGMLCIFLPALIIGGLGTIFWIWMLIDCLTNEPSQGNDKIVWFLVILFIHFIGAALYYFIRRSQRIRETGR